MASTQNIIDNIRRLLREDSSTDVPAIQNDFLFEAIMDGQSKWEDSFQIGGEDNESQVETAFNLVADTKLDEDITTATTDFDVVSGANLDDSGVLLLWDDSIPDFVSYTGKTVNNLTGVTGIGSSHDSGDIAQKVYKLPSNFGSFRESATFGDGVLFNGIPLKYMAGFPVPGFFSKYNDGTFDYLVLSRGATGKAGVLYNKNFTNINSLDDVVSVPDKYKFFLVWHSIAMCYVGREDNWNKLLAAESAAEKILRRALQNRNTGKRIRTRHFGMITRDYVNVGGINYPLSRE